MTGGAGDDIMLGLNGRDSLDAGIGDDYLVGGDNKDMLIGGPGNNTVKQGHDTSTTLASKISLDLDDSCNDAAFVIRPRAPKKWISSITPRATFARRVSGRRARGSGARCCRRRAS